MASKGKYWRVIHTRIGDRFHEGDVLTKEEIEAVTPLNRLQALGAVEPLYNDQGEEEYELQKDSRRERDISLGIFPQEYGPALEEGRDAPEKEGGEDDPGAENAGGNEPSSKDAEAKEPVSPTAEDNYESMTIADLRPIAEALGVTVADGAKKADIVAGIRKAEG